jgi:ribonuclease G
VKKIIINVNAWQTRIAILIDDKLDSIYFDSHNQESLERCFFKGKISKVLPGIQTAFVDIGQEKAGFLHISEIDRELAILRISKLAQMSDDDDEKQKPPTRDLTLQHAKRVNINKILKENDAILVQVSKEPVYQKGAKLTTCFTLPGRFIVLMPNIPRIGISKKIEDRQERIRLKDIVRAHLPEGMGGIIRTTSENQEAEHIVKDLTYLLEMWQSILDSYENASLEQKVYADMEPSLRVVRDHLDASVREVIVDDKDIQTRIYKFIKVIAPEFSHVVKLYNEPINIFSAYDIEEQIQEALERKVYLKSGGSLIIETTEAMTVIDVNTGKFVGKANLEETILQANLEAAHEIARQLRLRNIGGLIVIDFIDMAIIANRQRLLRSFEKVVKEHDKFQSVILKISEFGIVQMTRKRSGKTLAQQLTRPCAHCFGTGTMPSIQTESYALLRAIQDELLSHEHSNTIIISVSTAVFDYIANHEYNAMLTLEKDAGCKITLEGSKNLALQEYHIT